MKITVREGWEDQTVITALEDKIEVAAYVTPDGWFMKIIHVGTNPKPCELNFSSERVVVLTDLMTAVCERVKQEMIK